MQKYNLYEFNGYELIETLQKYGSETVDFSTRIRKGISGIIKSVEPHLDNALFYQTKECIREISQDADEHDFQPLVADWNEQSLKDILIYIDFSRVFPVSKYAARKFHWTSKTPLKLKQKHIQICLQILEEFFTKGFCIQQEDGRQIHYVPFEKSASMSRAGMMLFIDQRLYSNMVERLWIGFDFCGAPISASKLYAYTGLHLSNAKRICESADFQMNEETVIVLSDHVRSNVFVEDNVVSGFDPMDINGMQSWIIREVDDYRATVNYFDGEGLISPAYCAAVNDVLNQQYGISGTASSIQIRMPFTKGVIHNVDFHQFICEKLGISSCENVWIIDAFGQRRNLEKAQIILTRSMFKIDKWLSDQRISGLKEGEDPLGLYFQRFRKYDHAFYVGITDANLSQAGKTKLNYQFLNTLALTKEEMDELVNEQIKLANSDDSKQIFRNYHADFFDEGGDNEFEEFTDSEETWSAVVAKNPVFLNDRKVKGMLKGIRYSNFKDIGFGRMTVSGSTKILSRDLMAFLSFLISNLEVGELLTEDQKKQICIDIKCERLRPTKFFVADSIRSNPVFSREERRLKLSSREYYGLLRSPHLSRNEQCSLRPYIPFGDDPYTRYFGHLKGIIMVPLSSFVPQTLGGADFDGDLVKLITDPRVNRAINDTCYYTDTETFEKKHRRRLPVIMIPNTTPRKTLLTREHIDFQTLLDTFSSNVGLISNRAILFGKYEYGNNCKVLTEDVKLGETEGQIFEEDTVDYPDDSEFFQTCETCTILAGLEIDAAKTGRHPNLDMIGGIKEPNYFVICKKQIERLPEQYRYKIKEYPQTENSVGNVNPHRLTVTAHDGRELMTAVFTGEYPGFSELDELPIRCLKALLEHGNPELPDRKINGLRFSFEKDADWRKQITDLDNVEFLKDLINAYKCIMKTAREVYRISERLRKSNYVGCINTILRFQYKGLVDEAELTNLQEQVFEQLLVQFDSYQKAERALAKLVKEYQWQYSGSEEEKTQYLKTFLFKDADGALSEEVRTVLSNFRWNGYFLLYYYLKDIILYYREAETELQIEEGEKSEPRSERAKKYYHEFRKIYEQALSEKESRSIWNRQIIEECRKVLKEAFCGRVDLALMYTHFLRNLDPYGTFFWDVFTAKEILQKSEVAADAE